MQNITVLRANQLGDFIVSIPALLALKQVFPESRISYLGLPWHKEFLLDRFSFIDEVIEIPYYKGLRDSPDEIYDRDGQQAFFKTMRERSFDLGLQIHGGGRFSNPFLLELGCKKTVGLCTPDAPTLDICVPYVFFQQEIMKYISVAEAAGAELTTLDPVVPVLESDLQEAKPLLSSINSDFIVIHPGASDKKRRWPPEYFAEIGDHFAKKGYSIILTGTTMEKSSVKAVAETMKNKSINTCGSLSLGALTGLFSKACLVVTNDTGTIHLARAVKTPTVGIYWGPNLIHWGPLTTITHRVAASWQTHCSICKHNYLAANGLDDAFTFCEHDESYVSAIKPIKVIQLCDELLHTSHENVTAL